MRKIAISLIVITILFTLSLELKAKELTVEDFYGTWRHYDGSYRETIIKISPTYVVKEVNCTDHKDVATFYAETMDINNNCLIIRISGYSLRRYDGFNGKTTTTGRDVSIKIKFELSSDGEMLQTGGCLTKISNKYK